MDRIERILYLNENLLEEMPEYRSDAENFPRDDGGQRRLLRSLMNVRMPGALREDLLNVQDELLREEREEKASSMSPTCHPFQVRSASFSGRGTSPVWTPTLS